MKEFSVPIATFFFCVMISACSLHLKMVVKTLNDQIKVIVMHGNNKCCEKDHTWHISSFIIFLRIPTNFSNFKTQNTLYQVIFETFFTFKTE